MDIEKIILSFEKNNKLAPYYCFFNIFKNWAKVEWATILDQSQVDHSIEHSIRMISYFNEMHGQLNQAEIEIKYTPKYIIILICSIYTHDIGMQNYYQYRLKDLEGIKINNKGDLDRIRQVHADTIDKVYTLLSNDPHKIDYIDQELTKIKNEDATLYNILYNLIKELSTELALVTQFHNKSHSLDEFNLSIEKLIQSKKIAISTVDKARLVGCAGMLQLLDAIDMSKERINSLQFTIKSDHFSLPSISDMSVYDIYKYEKYINCYLIDEINIKSGDDHMLISINVSYSQANYHNHKNIIDKILDRYRDRLKRSGKDAISMIECLMKDKVIVHVENVQFDPLKLPINDGLINFLKTAHEDDFLKVLEKGMAAILPAYLPSYIKIYSQRLNLFFGGACCYFPPEVESYLSKIYFRNDDWNLIIQERVITIPDTGTFLKKANKKIIKSYMRYLKISKQFQSEIFIPMIYQNKLIGFLNCHYNYAKSNSYLQSEAKKLFQQIPMLTQKIIFQHVKDADKLLKLLSSFTTLSDDERKFLYDLFRSIFDDTIEIDTSYINVNDFVNELHEMLTDEVLVVYEDVKWDNNIPDDLNRHIHTNRSFTLKFLTEVIGEICDLRLEPDVTVKCETRDIYLVIDIYISDMIGSNGQIVSEIRDYLNSRYLIPDNAYQKKFDYPIITKILLYPLGGKISMEYDENGCHLQICMPSFEVNN